MDRWLVLTLALLGGPISVQARHTSAYGRAGATGYFGSVTEAALREYQTEKKLTPTGVYAKDTRTQMLQYGK